MQHGSHEKVLKVLKFNLSQEKFQIFGIAKYLERQQSSRKRQPREMNAIS